MEELLTSGPRGDHWRPQHQTLWEFLALGLALCTFAPGFTDKVALAVLGDNIGSLQALLDLSGSGLMVAIAQEIAWRRARYNWKYAVANLPSEQNKEANALSRLHAPDATSLPASLDRAVKVRAFSSRRVLATLTG